MVASTFGLKKKDSDLEDLPANGSEPTMTTAARVGLTETIFTEDVPKNKKGPRGRDGNGNGAHVEARTPHAQALAAIQSDLAKLAARVVEIGNGVDRDRAALEGRERALADEVARAKEASARASVEAEAALSRLRAELAAREAAVRAAEEEAASLRRRVDGFEGLKQAMQNL